MVFLTIRPAWATRTMLFGSASTPRSAVGSPSQTTRSASLPAVTLPSLSATPSSSAETSVPARIAASGDMPTFCR